MSFKPLKPRTRWTCQYCACQVEYEHPPDTDFKWLIRCQEHLTERDPNKLWLWDKTHQNDNLTGTEEQREQKARADYQGTLPRVREK